MLHYYHGYILTGCGVIIKSIEIFQVEYIPEARFGMCLRKPA